MEVAELWPLVSGEKGRSNTVLNELMIFGVVQKQLVVRSHIVMKV